MIFSTCLVFAEDLVESITVYVSVSKHGEIAKDKNGIHFEFVETPMYNSVYIEGIANLYEFDCGELSGWMYRVNGKEPTYGCSQYILKDKDNIEFFYNCNWRG